MRHVGNHVAEYRVEEKKCEVCDGMGEIYVDKKDFMHHLRDMRREVGASFIGLVKEYHEWKKGDGYVKCYNCGGKGYFEEWF